MLKAAVLALLSFYRSTLSPAIPSSCRFYPTCSVYAYEAVSQWGVGRGMWLALRRVFRCRPFGSFGYDPVPSAENVRSSSFVVEPDEAFAASHVLRTRNYELRTTRDE